MEKKDYLRGKGFDVEGSSDKKNGAYHYFQPIFIIFNMDNQYEIRRNYERSAIVHILGKEFRISKEGNEEIILPYPQISKTIDKLIVCSKNAFFRTSHEDLSKLIDYYVSGEFEKYHNYIESLSDVKKSSS